MPEISRSSPFGFTHAESVVVPDEAKAVADTTPPIKAPTAPVATTTRTLRRFTISRHAIGPPFHPTKNDSKDGTSRSQEISLALSCRDMNRVHHREREVHNPGHNASGSVGTTRQPRLRGATHTGSAIPTHSPGCPDLSAAIHIGIKRVWLELLFKRHAALHTGLVGGDRTFEEVGQFGNFLEFHEVERIGRTVVRRESQAP